MAAPRKVNVHVRDIADGGKQLVFEIAGTGECVGEMNVAFVPGYLPVMVQLFTQWASGSRIVQPGVGDAIKHAINGRH